MLLVLTMVGTVLLLALLSVGGYLLFIKDTDDGKDRVSAKRDDKTSSPTPTPSDTPTPRPSGDKAKAGETIASGPYRVVVPRDWLEIVPPISDYRGNNPGHENALAPESLQNGTNAIMLSAWPNMMRDGYSDHEKEGLFDQSATALGQSTSGTDTKIDGEYAKKYQFSYQQGSLSVEQVNYFTATDGFLIQIRCQYVPAEKTLITGGCDDVIASMKLG